MRKVIVLGVVLLGCTPSPKPPFPEKFYFGASTAGFQVDPGCPSSNCTDTRSDWYQWVTSENELQDLKELMNFEPLTIWPLLLSDSGSAASLTTARASTG